LAMSKEARSSGRGNGLGIAAAANAVAGRLAALALGVMRRLDRRRTSNFAARFLRLVGPLFPEHRVARANLTAAFPEKSPAEIETILAGVWDNLGRVFAELAHLDRMRSVAPEDSNPSDIEFTPGTFERLHRLRTDGKPALVFTAHLANWEIPALVATTWGLDTLLLYRRPNLAAVADALLAIRKKSMGTLVPTSLDAPIKLGRALVEGRHVAMVVDQHYGKGVEVTFFGRTCKANPLIAMLARQVDCPIHGTRVIRLPDGRFRGELTEAVETVRDAAGAIEVAGTMQVITSVVEGWVREHPEQWLWLHRRWR